MKSTGIAVVLTVILATVSFAQPANAPQMPNLGKNAKVVKTVKHYNFYPLTRTIPLPWDRLPLPSNQIPAGNKLLSAFVSPSAKVAAIQKDPAGKLKAFGTPQKQGYQSFNGKDGQGAIVFLEYANKLPANAKEVLSQAIFGKKDPPDPNKGTHKEQFLVNDNTVIIWAFQNDESQVRQNHQEMIFSLISEMGAAMNANKGK